MEPKNYAWKHDIYNQIVIAVETGLVPDVIIPNCDKVGDKVAPVPGNKQELIAQHRSRMNK